MGGGDIFYLYKDVKTGESHPEHECYSVNAHNGSQFPPQCPISHLRPVRDTYQYILFSFVASGLEKLLIPEVMSGQ